MFTKSSFFSSMIRRPVRQAHARPTVKPALERLEDRLAPAAAGVSFSPNQQTVTIQADGQTWTIARPVVTPWNYQATGTTLWVAPGGSDTADGSYSHPFATFARAVQAAAPGDIIYAMPGTYHEYLTVNKSGTAGAPIIISCAPGALGEVNLEPPPTLAANGYLLAGITLSNTQNVWINGLNIEGALGMPGAPVSDATSVGVCGISWDNGGGQGDQATNNVVYNNVHCGLKELGNGGTGMLLEGNVVFDNGSTFLDQGIYMPASDVTMIGNVIFDNASCGIQSYSHPSGQIITHNVIFGNGYAGILLAGSDNQVFDNTCAYNGDGIMYFRGGCTNNVVEYNTFAFNGVDCAYDNGGGNPLYGSPSDITNDYNCYYTGKPNPRLNPGAHEVLANPLFLNATAGDFRLAQDSPATAEGAFVGTTATLVSDFAGQGVWTYTPISGWQQISTTDASLLAINANGDVAAEFSGYGVFRYTAATQTWTQLTAANAALLAIDANGNVYADLAQAGLGIYEFTSPTDYKQLTPADPTAMAVDAGGDLVAVFQGYGVQELKNGAAAFRQIHPMDASQVAIDNAGDVFASFSGYGVGRLLSGASSWTTLNTANASLLAVDAAGDVAVVFSGYGVYREMSGAGSFTQLTSNSNVSFLAMDGSGDVFADFPGSGLWLAPGGVNTFRRLTVSDISNPSQDVAGDVFGAVPGQGVWRYTVANGWQQLLSVTPSLMAVDTRGDVAAVFSGYGTYLYSNATQTWQQIHPLSATLLAIDANGDVFAEFQGYGVYEYTTAAKSFQKLTSTNASLMVVDAAGDLFVEFPGHGVQELKKGATSFVSLGGADASLLAVDARGDVAAVFPGYGTYRLMAGAGSASWQQLNTTAGSQLAIDNNADVFVQFSGNPGVYRYVSPAVVSQVTSANAVSLTDDLAGDLFMDLPGVGFYRYTLGLGFQLLPGTQGDASVLA